MYDYSKLKGRMRELDKKQREVSKAAGMAPTTYSQKLNNQGTFKQKEIEDICNFLNIPYCDIPDYFFAQKV